MATPLTGLQHRDGGAAVMAGPVNQLDQSGHFSRPCVKNSAIRSPILIFLFFHKAIRTELDGLHRAAMAFATNQESDMKPLLERYHFLRSIYKHHCNAEDEKYFIANTKAPCGIVVKYLHGCNRGLTVNLAFSRS